MADAPSSRVWRVSAIAAVALRLAEPEMPLAVRGPAQSGPASRAFAEGRADPDLGLVLVQFLHDTINHYRKQARAGGEQETDTRFFSHVFLPSLRRIPGPLIASPLNRPGTTIHAASEQQSADPQFKLPHPGDRRQRSSSRGPDRCHLNDLAVI